MTYTRLLFTWLLLALLMPLNGILREFGLKRFLPAAAADWASAATGIAIILLTTRLLFRIPADEPTLRLAAQAMLLVLLTVAYEFGIGLMGGQSLAALGGHYALWRGEAWPLVLIALGATPFLWRGLAR